MLQIRNTLGFLLSVASADLVRQRPLTGSLRVARWHSPRFVRPHSLETV